MAGKIVQKKLGKGITRNSDQPVNGKVKIYLDNGKKILVSPENIKVLGFYD